MLLWARERFVKKVAMGLKIKAKQNIIPSKNIPINERDGPCGRQVSNAIRQSKMPVLNRILGIAAYPANNTVTATTTTIVVDRDDSLRQWTSVVDDTVSCPMVTI